MRGIFLCLLLVVFGSAGLMGGDSVPISEINYEISVDEWWSSHPLNPASRNHEAEIGFDNGVEIKADDHDGDLQKCINSLPELGGTVLLSSKTYTGGFRIFGSKNVHFVGEKGTRIVGGENYVVGSESTLDYGEFCEAVHQRKSDEMKTLLELPAQNIVFKNITFDDSPVRLAACRGILFDDCEFKKAENREVGDKDENGKKVLRWYRPLPVTGIMGLRDIWFRGCHFQGHNANAIYLDGPHCSGMINCRFADSKSLWHNAVLLFTNDDLSLDVNGNDRLEPFERRDVSYFVFDGCEFGSGYKRGAIAASGRDILVQNCKAEGPLESLLVVNAKTSGKKIFYESFGVKVRNNQLNEVSYIVTAEGPTNRPENGIADWWVWTKFEIGRFEIQNNQITGMKEALREMPRDGKIQGPHKIENNGPEVR